MLTLILVVLFVGVMVALAVLAMAFLAVAFERHPAAMGLAGGDWQLPWPVREQVKQWAASNAGTAVGRLLHRDGAVGRGGTLRSVYDAARSAMQRFGGGAVADRASSCSSCRHEVLGVTPLEAFAIAEQLKQSESPERLAEIRSTAAENARLAAALNADAYAARKRTCPLFSCEGLCAADPMRPLQCLGWCSAGGDGDAAFASCRGSRLDDAVWEGVRQGVQAGVASAHLDASVYELNAALVTALDTSDARQRWADGEHLFDQCKRVS